MLSVADVSSMQTTMTAALPDTCQIRRATLAVTAAGGTSRTWSVVATVACRFGVTQARDETTIAQETKAAVEYVFTFPAGTDVRAPDRLVVTTAGNRQFEVTAPSDGSWELSRRVRATELLPGIS